MGAEIDLTEMDLTEMDLLDQRQAWLLEQVETARRVTTTAAASLLGVSVDTIRRDLRQLHDRGLVRRVHGGALPVARRPEPAAREQYSK